MSKKLYKKYTKKTVTKSSDNLSSATYLIIVESPSKCAKIESYLGLNYCCISSKGHIRSVNGLKSIDTKESFEPKFTELNDKKDHIVFMKQIIAKFSKENIILATDDDREGEAIAWHICEQFGLPVETTPRIIFHEVTKNALLKAVKSPITINLDIVKAQHARQVLDVIVGYKISPMLWKYLYNDSNNSLSAGRCQTPALRLVYENQEESKQKNNIQTFYKTTASFFEKNIIFNLNVEFKTKDEIEGHLEKSINHKHRLTIGNPRDTTKSPPTPFHTSRLLQVASNILHISPSETMRLCQQLYQAGYITYMRTESTKYAKPFLTEISKYIQEQYGSEKYVGNLSELENKQTNNPHEAIRVTQLINKSIASDDTRLVSMYKLIWKNTVESCMTEAKYKAIPLEISGADNTKYTYTHEIPLFLGWKTVSEKKLTTDTQNEANGLHMFFQTQLKNEIKYNWIESVVSMKNKHSHYTEASLINKLENMGIGRPSTFSTIVSTIQERGYVKKIDVDGVTMECNNYKLEDNEIEETIIDKTFGNEKNKLVIQPIGTLTIEFLIKHYNSLFSYEYTKLMEDKLDLITNDNNEWSSICRDCYQEITTLSKPVSKIPKQTYPLDDTHVVLFEKYGPVIQFIKEDDTYEYISVKRDFKIDIDKLKKGEYTVEMLMALKERNIGKFKDIDVIIKDGKYGTYVEYGNIKESLKNVDISPEDLTLDDIIPILEKSLSESSKDKNILRELTDDLSVRKGKFGAYVFYKSEKMKKPQFLNIKKFKESVLACEKEIIIKWLQDNYQISKP
jgi:DNA topoisomerase I